jgi:tRNA A-37 threonylcarbamoyl transferase component Bud32/pimeloyl-ACP methyl ester carboxylesterase
MPLASGARLGPYEILAPIGAGAMGEVHRARDTRLGRDVAIKVIASMHARDEERIARFEQEARAAGALSHANVCAVYDVGVHESSPFVVMELLEGESLRATIDRAPITTRRALDLAAQIAEGLSAAHGKGIVHRDLKPENVFVGSDGHVKVLDFGVAKLMHAEASDDPSATITMTEPGLVLGTSAYMAPEQASGAHVDARADLFALGIVLFEMLTGQRPFVGVTPLAMMHAILRDEPKPLAALLPDAPPELARIIRRSLAKDPDRRIQTAKDVRNDLQDLQRELERGVQVGYRFRERVVEKSMVLTAAHVRELSERNPRLVGYPMKYADNGLESDTLVVLLHGIGGDSGRFEPVFAQASHRMVASTLLGFGHKETNRPVLSFDDHSRLLRILLRTLAQELQPKTTILVGHSAGADQFLRMIHDEEGLGIDVGGLVALGPNISLETCFASQLYTRLEPGNAAGTLAILKSLGTQISSLSRWLLVQSYLSHTFLKLGTDLEPLRRYAVELVAPFEVPGGDPLADWYRAAKKKIGNVQIVLSNAEAGPGEALLARHLEHNVLGDDFTEASFVIEPVDHLELLNPELVLRHVEHVRAQAIEAR